MSSEAQIDKSITMALGSSYGGSRDGSMARSERSEGVKPVQSGRGVAGQGSMENGGGARSKTPPGTPKKVGKLLGVRVQMLDDSITLFQVQAKASGKMLFDQVCKQLNLLETDYFGLEYVDNKGTTYWLDREKAMNQQIGLGGGEPLLRFNVKFYMPDPSQLEEEYTRYLFSLQIKRDLASGQLQCNDNTAALMASYIVQAECGDFVVEDYPDHTYLSSYKFVPGQDAELERRICDNHKKHNGQSPAEADLNLLETARRCELYGTKMHSGKDHEGVPLNLAVVHLGVVVFQNCTKINTFSWAKIRKLSFKRKKFLIKLHPEGYGYYKDIVEFYFDERNHCKNFWKKCVEHHGFFRCTDTLNIMDREKPRIISRGSSFRYSGRTQKQMQEHVRENFVKRQSFQRHVRSLHGSSSNVGNSISAQPLLPVGDNDVAGTPASLSCGSMTLCSDDPHSICSLGSMISNHVGVAASRLRDFDNLELDSPFSGRRPSSHTAYVPEPRGSQNLPQDNMGSPPVGKGGQGIGKGIFPSEPHLPNFHHDHLHHQGQDQLGVATLQPNTQRRERAREALLRRNLCDFNVSIDSTQTNSGSSRTTENPTDATVVQKQVENWSGAHHSSQHSLVNRSTHSIHSAHSVKSLEDQDSAVEHLSSEDNLSHESYDLLDGQEEDAHINTFSENMKTVLSRSELSFDNSLSYAPFSGSIPHTPSKGQSGNNEEAFGVSQNKERSCLSLREDLINSNNLNNGGSVTGTGIHSSKPNSHSSTYSSHQSMKSCSSHSGSGQSTQNSPLPELQISSSSLCPEPVSILSTRRKSSGSIISQKSVKSTKETKNEPPSDKRLTVERLQDKGHFLSEDQPDEFSGHEIHMERSLHGSQDINRNQPLPRDQTRDSGMHENFIFKSPTNAKYFSSQIQSFNSRTLPNRKRHEKSPVIFTRGKLSIECSSNSSSSHASPRICRPKSLDFSVVARLQDLPHTNAYSYRDDTIDQLHDFDNDSSFTSSVHMEHGNNYAGSSSDVPQTPEMPDIPVSVSSKIIPSQISAKTTASFNPKPSMYGFQAQIQERIYDIPEGIEREEIPESNSPVSESSETKTVYPNVMRLERNRFTKSYLGINRKFSSEESESTSNRPLLKILPPVRVLKKVSSTESESAQSNQSIPQNIQFDSDTLSLPLDLLSPPMESESSTALVESESLPAPPQFGSNKDDTDIEDDVTPRVEEIRPDSPNLVSKMRLADKNISNRVLESQSTIESFNRLAYSAEQDSYLKLKTEPVRQESTFEERAEKMLESQTTVDSFTDDHPIEFGNDIQHIINLDTHPINGKLRDNLLLKALDTFDSFNAEHEFPITRRQDSKTYEDEAESMLERQTTVDSFTSQLSTENDVFMDQNMDSGRMQEFVDNTFGTRTQVLESQSTLESFTTEREVLITKRQESTYEERAEYLLESQNTIDSFTNEVPNEEAFHIEPMCSESNFVNTEDYDGQINKTDDETLVADMYVRHLHSEDSLSINEEPELDHVPFIDENLDHNFVHGMKNLACGTGNKVIFNNFVALPQEQHVETIFIPRSSSNDSSSFDQPSLDHTREEFPGSELSQDCLDYPTGPYDIINPPPPLPPDDFGNYSMGRCSGIPMVAVGGEPLFYPPSTGSMGYGHGQFPPRALSRISEKSSGESGGSGTGSNETAEVFDEDLAEVFEEDLIGESQSDQEANYTTSEDNDNAPSISSDLPENMANGLCNIPNTSFDDIEVEYSGMRSQASSEEESPKHTEYTQIDQDTLEEEDDDDLDDTNADEIKTEEELDEIPPDFRADLTNSLTSENEVSNKNSEGSLHDSMEILEDINTDDHFERDEKTLETVAEDSTLTDSQEVKMTRRIGLKPEKKEPKRIHRCNKPVLLTKPSISLSENSGKYVVTEGSEEIIL